MSLASTYHFGSARLRKFSKHLSKRCDQRFIMVISEQMFIVITAFKIIHTRTVNTHTDTGTDKSTHTHRHNTDTDAHTQTHRHCTDKGTDTHRHRHTYTQ